MTDTAILSKVKKLLALATSNQPHEAAAALAKAQELMAAHGLTVGQATAPEVVVSSVGSRVSASRVKSWELMLMRTVAKAFGCKILWSSHFNGSTGAFRLLGTSDRVTLATHVAVVLQRKLYAARAKFIDDLKYLDHVTDRSTLTERADGYCTGWVVGVAKPIRELALPQAEVNALAAKEREMAEGRKAKTQVRDGDAHSQGLGYSDGARESLYRPMSDDTSPIKRLA